MRLSVTSYIVVAMLAYGMAAHAAPGSATMPTMHGGTVGPHRAPEAVFEFMGANTDDAAPPEQLNRSICSAMGDNVTCTDYEHPTIAGRPMRWLSQDYYKGRLYHVYAAFGDGAYGSVLAAFIAKYGNPSGESKVKWESKGGAVFDNQVTMWDFKKGTLELDSIGLEVGSGSFEFLAPENAPPPAKPKVDF